MCMLLKLCYARFDVSRLFRSKGIEDKLFGGSARPPPVGKGRGKTSVLTGGPRKLGPYSMTLVLIYYSTKSVMG